MIRKLLSNTTAIALTVSLATPSVTSAAFAAPDDLRVAQAEEAGKGAGKNADKGKDKAENGSAELCEDGSEPPCEEPAEAAETEAETQAEGAEEAAIAPGKSGETAGQAQKPEAEAEAETVGETKAAAEAGQSDEAPGQVKKAEEEEPAAAETDAEATGETEAAADVGQSDKAPDQVKTTKEEPAAAEAETEEIEETEAAAEAGQSDKAPDQVKTTEEEEGPAAAEAEETEETEAEADKADEAPGQMKKAEEGEPAEVDAEAETAGEAEAATGAEIAEGADAASDDEAPQAAAAADAEGEESPEPTEVTTEIVTEETTRTSDEEPEAALAERRQVDGDDDDNDNDLLKILGAAAGGLAVGALLSQGGRLVENTGDRAIIERDGEYFVRKDETELLRRPGSEVQTRTFSDGSTRTVVTRDDGTQVVTIRDGNGYVVRRTRLLPDGSEIVLFDDTGTPRTARVETSDLPPLDYGTVRQDRYVDYGSADRSELRSMLMTRPVADLDRSYTLRQVREDWRVRSLMPRLDLDSITFDFGSSAITAAQARKLDELGWTMEEILDENPNEVFLIEGHTDAVGSRIDNLMLSDRRAETVALALTEYFDIPPENLITQGYGEEFLKVEVESAERANRRATVRRITPLLERTAQAQ